MSIAMPMDWNDEDDEEHGQQIYTPPDSHHRDPRERLEAIDEAKRLRLQELASRLVNVPYSPWTPTERQRRFLLDFNKEVLYGGAVGGAKSVALLMAALQFVEIPGYSAILFRRSFADLNQPGALMVLAKDWLAGKPGTYYDPNTHTWYFPSKASITFGYMERQNDHLKYQGAAYQFCVARDTPVLMGDGSWRRIDQIAVGEEVETLEGPRPVTAVHDLGVKPVTELSNEFGSVRVGPGHRVAVIENGSMPLSRRSSSLDTPGGSSRRTGRGWPWRRGSRSSDPRPDPSPWPPPPLGSWRMVTSASSTGDRTGSATSGGPHRVAQPLPQWFGRVALHGPAARSVGWLATTPRATHGSEHAQPSSRPGGSTTGCPTFAGSGDAQRDQSRGSVHRGGTRRRGRAGRWNILGWLVGGRGRTQGDALPPTLDHPYTTQKGWVLDDVVAADTRTTPAGEAEVFDLTVASASHYITSGGFVHSNCGFDEVTQHQENQYKYMFSRLRKPAGGPLSVVPLRMRATANPGGPGHEWVFRRFIVGYEQWKAGKAPKPIRTFIPSMLADNPHLDREAYLETLAELDPVTRAQLLKGDWSIRPSGRMFQRSWFQSATMADINPSWPHIRYWDLAATDEEPGKDPDWTAGCLMYLAPDGRIFIANMVRTRQNPAKVERLIYKTAEMDGHGTPVYIEQEPGSAGKAVIHYYRSRVLKGWQVYPNLPSGKKTVRAAPVASQGDAGNVYLVGGRWNEPFLDEVEIFPDGFHDDQVDAMAGAYQVLAKRPHALVFGGGDPTGSREAFVRSNPWQM